MPSREERRKRRAAAARQYERGVPLHKIAETFGLSISSIRDACTENGVMFSENNRPPAGRTLEILAEIINSGDTIARIAERMDISRQRVHAIKEQAKELGIPLTRRRRTR